MHKKEKSYDGEKERRKPAGYPRAYVFFQEIIVGTGGVQRVPLCTRYVPTPSAFEGLSGCCGESLAPNVTAVQSSDGT